MERLLLTDLLFRHKVRTTAARAKHAIPMANRALHLAASYEHASKADQLTIRRRLLSLVYHPLAAQELIDTIAPTLNKPTVLQRKLPARSGDSSPMIELSLSIKEPKAKEEKAAAKEAK